MFYLGRFTDLLILVAAVNLKTAAELGDASRANEKKAAIAARAAVRWLLEANSLRFTFTDVEHDKFGRVLGKVFVNGVDVEEYLIANRLTLWYDGGMREELDGDKLDQGLMW